MSLEQHPPFLISVPITHNPDSPGDAARAVGNLLDTLGNPAAPALQEVLGASGVIHFMSMAVVWDERDHSPPMLVAHVAGDGTPRTIIAAVVEHAGLLLLPVFRVAAGVESPKALQKLLLRHWISPAAVAFPLWPHRVTGLPFQGTPGLTVGRIREDARIAREAKEAVLEHARGGSYASLSYLDVARRATGCAAKPGGKRFTGPETIPSLAKAGRLSQTYAILSLSVLDWSFLFILLFVTIFLNVKNLIHPLLDHQDGRSHEYLYSIPIALAFGLVLNFAAKMIVAAVAKRSDNNRLYMWAWAVLLLIAISTFATVRISQGLQPPDFIAEWFQPFAWWVAGALGLLSLVLFILIVVGALLIALRFHETRRAKPDDGDQDPALLAAIMRREDRPSHRQNHIFSAATLPNSLFRRFISLPVGLYVASLTVKAGIFRTGFLAGIRTIHFIQWARLPGANKLVFTGDYDGSWQSYLEDAVSTLPTGATGIWSNTIGFPKTKWLFFEGAKDGDRFKRWVRRQMIPTRFWYSAYPKLTASEIRRNARIRRGLEAATTTPSEADDWLREFGSTSRPVSEVETDQIQGIVLSGYRKLLEGALLPVVFPKDKPDACRAWLADVGARVDFGDAPQKPGAMAVALSAHGLKGLDLGVAQPLAAQFSSPFAMGMESGTRSNALGDRGESAPAEWKWGGTKNPVDAVLLIYAEDRTTMSARLKTERDACVQAGLQPLPTITFHEFPPPRDPATGKVNPIIEPFGFVDGISQPSIRGLRSSHGANDVLEPGEFILGYHDGRGTFPSTPQVFAADDPHGLLPDLDPGFPGQPSRRPVRDLGRNGSYLVVRQLEQDVDAYRTHVEAAAGKLGETAETISAKMVGRWRNGAPLVLFPHGPPESYDPTQSEDFLFGRDDPRGLACPFGAHIRRANPRDQFDPDDKSQISINNRHRLLRRGRNYVERDADSAADPRGLMFMCLNADIERQFEFVQQTWICSTAFGPLTNEADPLLAPTRTDYTIPTLDGPRQLTNIPSFVKMIGGGYFFLPGRQALTFLSREAPRAGEEQAYGTTSATA